MRGGKLLFVKFRWHKAERASGSAPFPGDLCGGGNPLRGDYFQSWGLARETNALPPEKAPGDRY